MEQHWPMTVCSWTTRLGSTWTRCRLVLRGGPEGSVPITLLPQHPPAPPWRGEAPMRGASLLAWKQEQGKGIFLPSSSTWPWSGPCTGA